MLSCSCLSLAALWTMPSDAIEADYVLQHVTIHDGNGGEAPIGDVAIRGDRIVALGEFQTAGTPRCLDGTGLIAAPGFIDLHTHSDGITAPPNRLNKNYTTQGVTTVVTGNCGGGPLEVAEYLKKIDAAGAGTNLAHVIPHGDARRKAMGTEKRPSTPAELDRMKQLVAEGMKAGAWGLSTGLISFGMQEEDVRMIMKLPFVATASDGGICAPDNSVPHPRNYGCFPRKIGRYAIADGIVPSAAAVRSATGLPAEIFGFERRGYLRVGYFADIVVFDPKTFRDTATFDKPHQYTPGVQYLFVNGQLAIEHGKTTGRLSGRALRHAAGSG